MADSITVEIAVIPGGQLEVTNGRARLTAQGDPEDGGWMPTELFLSGLGSCMLATLAYAAGLRQLDVTGASVRVTGETAKGPTRLGRIQVAYDLPAGLSGKDAAALIRAAGRCKVHNTLTQAPPVEVTGEAPTAPGE